MLNEAFHVNVLGRTVKFDVQPYQRGTGEIVSATPRRVKTRQFLMPYGTTNLEYEVFDLKVKCTEGVSVGALSAGVPLSHKPLAGQTVDIIGVDYFKLYDAAYKNGCIVIARCG